MRAGPSAWGDSATRAATQPRYETQPFALRSGLVEIRNQTSLSSSRLERASRCRQSLMR